MSAPGDALAHARAVADAVLYEGYVLFPYRASTTKNRFRWQFGVVIPEAQARVAGGDPAAASTQVLLRAGSDTPVSITTRFLHPRRRTVLAADADGVLRPTEELEVGGVLHTSWEEGIEGETTLGPYPLASLLAAPQAMDIQREAAHHEADLLDEDGVLAGRVVHSAAPVHARLEARARALGDGIVELAVSVRNITDWADADAPREEVTRRALVGLHLLLAAPGGAFASAIDPPQWAIAWSGQCTHHNTFPVLAGADGGDDVLLCAPIILYDHPVVAPESSGPTFDATEIDELLTLCVLGLTDEEKRAARATDPRAAELIDRAETLPDELLERLHGAVRELRPADSPPPYGPGGVGGPSSADARRDDSAETAPGQPLDAEVAAVLGVGESPIERARINGAEVSVGDRVRLRPARRADAQDVFAAGRIARVGKIVETDAGAVQVGVVLEDDPAAELHEWYGRYLYFHTDEVALIDDSEAATDSAHGHTSAGAPGAGAQHTSDQ